ncbi:MAG: protein O-mannosyl-transferase [Verrucomicrobiota bacterium]
MTQSDIKPAIGSSWSKLARYAERDWVRCLVLILFGTAVHIPSLTGELLWDDVSLVNDNPLIKSPVLILEAFRHYLFPDAYAGHYRPVQTISYIFDYLFWDNEPYGYHLSNVFWHVLSGVLLYYLLRRILGSLVERWPGKSFWTERIGSSTAAFFLALLWIVHPVHSAAVDYVSGRADSLAFFFACAGWLLYFRARDLSPSWARRGLFVLALLSALLSLCSRESGALWMLLFLLYVFAFESGPHLRAKFLVLGVCLMVAMLYAGLRQLPEHHSENGASPGWTPAMRGVLMLRALGDYGRLMVFPSHLHIERTVFEPASGRGQTSWWSAVASEGLSVGGVLLLGALLFGALRKGAGQRARIFGASWFLLTYLPISNLFDLNATVAEHWLYLPSVGFCIFFAGVLLDLPTRYLRATAALACAAVVVLSLRSAVRSSDWADPETFFRRTFAAGGSSSRIGVNLGVIYALRGEHVKAEAILRKVLEAFPDYPLARNNLAIALSHQGKTKEAEAMFETATNSAAPEKGGYPRTWDAARNLARLRHKEKDDVAAFSILEKALRDYPGNWELVRFQAQMIREIEGPASALPIVKSFVREHWWHAGASITLGGLFLEVGDLSQAEETFRHASWLDVHDAEALNLMALLSVRQNKLEDACKTQRRAVARQPDQPRQYLLLSDILTKMGRTEEARETLGEVSRLESMARPRVAAN